MRSWIASWNRTWYYDPESSAAFGGLGMKDGGGSGSNGGDGYIALYTVLPCVAIIFVLIVSFLVLVSVWVRCYVFRKRRVNVERKVPFLLGLHELISSARFAVRIMAGKWSNHKFHASHLCHDKMRDCFELTHLTYKDYRININRKFCAKLIRKGIQCDCPHEPKCLQ